MKPVAWYLCLPLAFPFCALTQAAQENVPPAVTVYTQFQKPYSAISLDEMKHELAAIMGPLGLDFTWRSLDAVRGNEVSAELVVVTFQGTCGIEDELTGFDPESGPLGWTHVSDGTVLPFSDVDCDKVRRFIAADVRGFDPLEQKIRYGRALGRVLSHEFYHVFTNATHHASGGVAKACYTSRDLVCDHFQFQEKDTKELRSGRLKSVLQIHRPPVLSFGSGGR